MEWGGLAGAGVWCCVSVKKRMIGTGMQKVLLLAMPWCVSLVSADSDTAAR